MSQYDIERAISQAKLGSARKDAQIDACEPFAAALFDVLTSAGIDATVFCATFHLSHTNSPLWAHAVVRSGGRFYDSMGLFDHDTVRARQRIHKTVQTELRFTEDVRDFDARDWAEMHAFCLKKLSAALKTQTDLAPSRASSARRR